MEGLGLSKEILQVIQGFQIAQLEKNKDSEEDIMWEYYRSMAKKNILHMETSINHWTTPQGG